MRFLSCLGLAFILATMAAAATNPSPVTFTKDVAPILQKNCQSCHRPGEAAPMSFLTYQEVRPWAKQIREAVLLKRMPPWFADPHYGKFSNDRSLSQQEIDTLVTWANTGAREGDPKDMPKPLEFTEGWNIGKPDIELAIQNEFPIPASGTIDYQYIKVPTGFAEDKWIQAMEIKPSNPKVVHHLVLFIREPGSKFMEKAKPGEPVPLPNSRPRQQRPDTGAGRLESAGASEPEILGTYVPGGAWQAWKPGQAKLIKAGSDLVFQMHYTANGTATTDRSRVGLVFAKQPPTERIRGVVITNRNLVIPPGAPDQKVEAKITLPQDVTLTGFFPHMHVRGKSFEYKAVYPTGESEILLSVPNYDFNWQLYYYPVKPVLLPKGTQLECTAHFDNSPNKKGNPDPTAEVRWGDQSWDEMLAGFVDIATKLQPDPVTFTKDVAAILQKNCQSCHRPGEAAPMSFLTYQEVRPWAKQIREAVLLKRMPPWFADPHYGKFSNDRSLSRQDIDTLVAWANTGAREGDPKDMPKPVAFFEGWNIGKPDVEIEMPKEFNIPATGTIEYQYIVIPANFTEDKWVQMAEVRPGNRAVLHHVIAFVREPNSKWLKDAKPGEPFVPVKRSGNNGNNESNDSGGGGQFLVGYAPGTVPEVLEPGQAKLIKAGSDIVFQMHYTANGKAAVDRTKIGIIFAKEPPKEKVVTLAASNNKFVIPAGDSNYKVDSQFEFGSDAKVIAMLPHMHLRGKDFEYRVVYPTGESETILRVPKYSFSWQLSYYFEKPLMLPKGTKIECTAHFDNSVNNPNNPDAAKEVKWGDQSWEEMMIGFFDVAMDVNMDVKKLFPEKKKRSDD